MKTEYLLHQEAEKVLSALTPVNRRIMRVCMHTGLRVGDVVSLRTEQIKPITSVVEKKTGKRRRIGLPKVMCEDIIARAGTTFAFPGRKPDTHQTRQAVWKDVKRASVAFRMPQNVAPHSFRKLYAVRLMKKYQDVKRVQRALKHSHQDTTMIYAMADKLLAQRVHERNRYRLGGNGPPVKGGRTAAHVPRPCAAAGGEQIYLN